MRRNPILAIFTTVFIDLVGFGILIPVFPLLIAVGSPFRVTPESWSFTQGLVMLGWLQAVYPFCTFIASPILGQLSDRFGRRPVLALSIFGTSIGYVIFAIGSINYMYIAINISHNHFLYKITILTLYSFKRYSNFFLFNIYNE
jgi:DHA1 family tetracycline resistance protein-like MFS transporter